MSDAIEILLRTAILIVLVMGFVRLMGLRAFSKMSSFDFALTVATGSILASSVVNPGTSLGHGMAALASVFAVQAVIGWVRRASRAAEEAIDNTPLLLMRDGTMLPINMARANVTESDLRAKLRAANALDLSSVHAVVFETTGDISVLHGQADRASLERLLNGVRGA
ncbi:MAG: DUF421 domain-containing protein [Paracoccaceae bacterium]